MHRRILIPMLLMIIIGCPSPPLISGLECSIDKGLVWHDVYLINESGKDLHEVKVVLTLTGEDDQPRTESRYYALWSNGQTIKTPLSEENSPYNVQKISLVGSCTEGKIDSSWPNPPKGIPKPSVKGIPVPSV